MITFQQTDTAAVCTAAAFCSGLSANTDTQEERQASEGGTAGSSSGDNLGIDGSASDLRAVYYEIIDGTNNLVDLDGATGDWVVRHNCTKADSDITWESVHICRVNSSCTNQETIASASGLGISYATTGVKSSGNVNQGSTVTMAAGDKIMIVLGFSNANSMVQRPQTADDQLIDCPWSAGGDVEVALTGVVGTSAEGTLDKTVDKAITGVVGTSAVGTLNVVKSLILAGVLATSAVGTITENHPSTVPLTGVAATAAVGSIGFTESGNVGLTGVAGTSAVGTLGVSIGASEALTGEAATSAVGTLDKTLDVALTGVNGTAAIEALGFTESGTVGLTGVQGTSAVGAITENHPSTVAITGVQGTSAVGTVSPGNTQALTGVLATGSVGTVVASVAEGDTAALTGEAATSAVGNVSPINTQVLTGVAGTAAIGALGFTESGTVGLTGVQGTSAVGTITENHPSTVALTGIQGAAAEGSVGFTESGSVALTGVAATGAVGSVSQNRTVALTGVQGTSAVGTITENHPSTVAISGVAGISAIGGLGFTESGSVGLTGVAGTSAVGSASPSNTQTLTGVQGTSAVGIALAGVPVGYIEGGVVRKAVDEISGLFHLVNEDVVILADGNVVSGHSVDSTGKLSPNLARKASRVHIGKQFISDIETLDIEPPRETIQSLKVKVNYVTLRLEKTRGLLVGPNVDNLRQMKFRENEKMSNPTDLFTNDKSITLNPTWKSNGRVFIRQQFPLPVTLLAAIPDITVGGK